MNCEGHFAGRANCSEGVVTIRDYEKVTPLQAASCARKGRCDLRESRRLTDMPGVMSLRHANSSSFKGCGRPPSRPSLGR